MSSLFKRTRTDKRTGKTVQSQKWYGQCTDEFGQVVRKPLSANKVAAQRMLNEIVKRVELARVDGSGHLCWLCCWPIAGSKLSQQGIAGETTPAKDNRFSSDSESIEMKGFEGFRDPETNGEGGIRTLVTLAGKSVFETDLSNTSNTTNPNTFNIPPDLLALLLALNPSAHPELVRLLTSWPHLPDPIRSAILTLADSSARLMRIASLCSTTTHNPRRCSLRPVNCSV